MALAKERRPGGLELYTFQVNDRARRFYERHGFVVAWLRRRLGQRGGPAGRAATAGSRDGRPAQRSASSRGRHADRRLLVRRRAAARARPRRDRRSHDVAIGRTGARARVPAPRGRSARSRRVRRWLRSYAIEREFEDLAAVADDARRRGGHAVDVVGHSYGGRCALGAALLTQNIRRLVVYEGAPSPSALTASPGWATGRSASSAGSQALIEAGDRDARSGDVHAGDRPDAGRRPRRVPR